MTTVITRFRPERAEKSTRRSPHFGYPDFGPVLRQYRDGLQGQRVAAMGNPLYIGRVLDNPIQIDPITPPTYGRPIPRFAQNGGQFKLRICDAIKPFRGGKQRSQMWLADILDVNERMECGQVLMKIVQQSFLQLPASSEYNGGYIAPVIALQLAALEDVGYTHCFDIQGIHIPYCFGFYKYPMPHGEDAYILLLEYIRGEQFSDWVLRQPHSSAKSLGSTACTPESVMEAIELTKAGVTALRELHMKCKVLCQSVRPDKLIICQASTGQRQVMMYDFSTCQINVDGGNGGADEERLFLGCTRDCCKEHQDAIVAWASKEDFQLPAVDDQLEFDSK